MDETRLRSLSLTGLQERAWQLGGLYPSPSAANVLYNNDIGKDNDNDDDILLPSLVRANIYSSPSTLQVHLRLFPILCYLTQSLQHPSK